MEELDAYRTNADFLGDVLLVVHVDLVEVRVRELLRELLEDGRDDLARATPCRPEVDYNRLLAIDL